MACRHHESLLSTGNPPQIRHFSGILPVYTGNSMLVPVFEGRHLVGIVPINQGAHVSC